MPSMLPYGLAEQLKAAKAEIDTPEKWASSFEELARSGKSCAVTALYHGGVEPVGRKLIDSLHECHHLADFNDSHSHAEVMALFDRAIEAAS
jgi:hypothetical protein